MFHPTSLIISFMVLAPNLIFFILKPNNLLNENETKENPILSAIEGIGRIGVFILPLLSSIHVNNSYEIAAFTGMLISIVLYYFGWVRYFTHNREYGLLFSPIMGIPVPMAITPIAYFLFASVVLHSPYLFVSSVILAVGHVPISLNTYYQIWEKHKKN